MKVLLVNNDRNQHETLREIVRRIDPTYTFLGRFSTESAFDFLLETDCVLPDLMFLDLTFREGDGKQMLKDMKRVPVLRDIPVCIYTDSAEQGDRDDAQNLGVIGYITKENNLTGLTESIRSMIDSTRGEMNPVD